MRCAMVSRAFILYLCCETTFRHLFVVSRRIYASISLPVPQCISIRFVCLFWFVSSTTTTTLWSFRNYHVRHFQRLLFCLKASYFSIIHFQDASHTHTHTARQNDVAQQHTIPSISSNIVRCVFSICEKNWPGWWWNRKNTTWNQMMYATISSLSIRHIYCSLR